MEKSCCRPTDSNYLPANLATKDVPLNLHLLLPLFSSVAFVLAMMYVRQGISRGARPWTGTFYGNLWLGLVWLAVGLVRQDVIPVDQWHRAALVGLMFVVGQLLMFMAYRFGEVSVATPIFGVKILFVAVLSSLMAGQQIPILVWLAACVATGGVVLVQSAPPGEASLPTRGVALTVILAIATAVTMSLFDVLLQDWGPRFGALRFLPVMFTAVALISLVILPWTDRLATLRTNGALRPLLLGTLLLTLQAIGMAGAISQFGDATRVNIVYALRGLWAVALAWLFARTFEGNEQYVSRPVMLRRAVGAALLTAAVAVALSAVN